MRKNLISIQYLRALAALMVVIDHAQMMIPTLPRFFPNFIGRAGVLMFFAISGFLMVHITETRERSPIAFLVARFRRIVPLYWIFTIGTAAMFLLMPAMAKTNELSLRHLILSLLFVPHLTGPDPDSWLPMLKPGWSLIYEVFFYSLFAAAMTVSLRHRSAIAIFSLLALAGVYFFAENNFIVKIYCSPIILEFALGMSLAVVLSLCPNASLPAFMFPVGIIAGYCTMLTLNSIVSPQSESAKIITIGIPAFFIIACAIMAERQGLFVSKSLKLIGDSSYSLYLMHMFPLAGLRWLWGRVEWPTSGIATGIIAVMTFSIIAVLFGIMSYFFIEKPVDRYSRYLKFSLKI